jgi:hypothetical protein
MQIELGFAWKQQKVFVGKWQIFSCWKVKKKKRKKLFTMTFANCSTLFYGFRAHTREQSRKIERGRQKEIGRPHISVCVQQRNI